MTENYAAVNAKMVRFCPELDSVYARYPMSHKQWLDLKEKSSSGEKAFIKSTTNQGFKKNYVFGRGPFGEGYYHIMTKHAYVNLYHRLMSEAPMGGCCACSKEAKQTYDQWDDVKRIVHARSVASRPDDLVARRDQENDARDTAQMWHNGLQNEQLAVNIVNAVNIAR